MWNQSRIGGAVTPVAARIDRRPAHPSVKPVNTVERSADQGHEIRLRSGHGCEHLTATRVGLGVADPDFQMPFALFTAADERRVHADRDRRRGRCGRDHRVMPQLFAERQGVAA
jgi:hypothetical protein